MLLVYSSVDTPACTCMPGPGFIMLRQYLIRRLDFIIS